MDRARAVEHLDAQAAHADGLAARLRDLVASGARGDVRFISSLSDADRELMRLVAGDLAGVPVPSIISALEGLSSSAAILRTAVVRANLRRDGSFTIRTDPVGGDAHLSHAQLALLLASENLASLAEMSPPALHVDELSLLSLAVSERSEDLAAAAMSFADVSDVASALHLVSRVTSVSWSDADGRPDPESERLRKWLLHGRWDVADRLAAASEHRRHRLSEAADSALGLLASAPSDGPLRVLSTVVSHLDSLAEESSRRRGPLGRLRRPPVPDQALLHRASDWWVGVPDAVWYGSAVRSLDRVADDVGSASRPSDVSSLLFEVLGAPGRYGSLFAPEVEGLHRALGLDSHASELRHAARTLRSIQSRAERSISSRVRRGPDGAFSVDAAALRGDLDACMRALEGLRSDLSSSRAALAAGGDVSSQVSRVLEIADSMDLVRLEVDGFHAPTPEEWAEAVSAAGSARTRVGPDWAHDFMDDGWGHRLKPLGPYLDGPAAAPVRALASSSPAVAAVAGLLAERDEVLASSDPSAALDLGWYDDEDVSGYVRRPHGWLVPAAAELGRMASLADAAAGRRSESGRVLSRAARRLSSSR